MRSAAGDDQVLAGPDEHVVVPVDGGHPDDARGRDAVVAAARDLLDHRTVDLVGEVEAALRLGDAAPLRPDPCVAAPFERFRQSREQEEVRGRMVSADSIAALQVDGEVDHVARLDADGGRIEFVDEMGSLRHPDRIEARSLDPDGAPAAFLDRRHRNAIDRSGIGDLPARVGVEDGSIEDQHVSVGSDDPRRGPASDGSVWKSLRVRSMVIMASLCVMVRAAAAIPDAAASGAPAPCDQGRSDGSP